MIGKFYNIRSAPARLTQMIFAILFLSGALAAAEAPNNDWACPMKIEINENNGPDIWRAINDGVMGGKSSGGPEFTDKAMIFKGVINTNGGGFSSIRADAEPGSMADYDGIRLSVKSDGRQYKMTFRTDETHRWRRVSFQGEIPLTAPGEWSDVYVAFDDLKASLFGRSLRGKNFDKNNIREIGIILADGKDGPFELQVNQIAFCRQP